jgi:uncharacterized protein (DUF924 family)
MAKIIIYDQVTRNVIRNTSDANAYDHISREVALKLFDILDSLPIKYRLTILICLCHSENVEHQTNIRININSLLKSKYYVSH